MPCNIHTSVNAAWFIFTDKIMNFNKKRKRYKNRWKWKIENGILQLSSIRIYTYLTVLILPFCYLEMKRFKYKKCIKFLEFPNDNFLYPFMRCGFCGLKMMLENRLLSQRDKEDRSSPLFHGFTRKLPLSLCLRISVKYLPTTSSKTEINCYQHLFLNFLLVIVIVTKHIFGLMSI